MKKVLIATPSYDGKIDAWYANSLVNTILLGIQKDIFFQPIYMSYDALVQRARNDLVAIAIENDFDDILWIDSDIEWNPEKAIEILELDQDIIGLPVIKKTLDLHNYNIKSNVDDLFVRNDDGLIKVESVGTGFLKMSKKAFTYLWDNSEEYTHNGKICKWIFNVSIIDGDLVSEDVFVCRKLNEGGFDIWIDPSSTCNHIGNIKYSGNFENFIKILDENKNSEKEKEND